MSLAYKGSASQHSRSMSHITSDIEELTDAELIKQVNDLKQQIKFLTLENEVLEKTIMRLDPALMNGVQQALEYANKLQCSSNNLGIGSFIKSQTSRFGLESLASPSRMLASPSRMLTSPSRASTRRVESSARIGGTVVFGAAPKINVLERTELVTNEMETVVNTLEKSRMKAAKKHALLKAQLEELDVRVTDIQKAVGDFNQEVLIDGWDKIAQRIPAEIWIRYMTEWVKIADSQIGKLRLRTSTLNSQFSKLKGQIRMKTELSESLTAVDFQKMKIENDECQEIIDNKIHQLIELKKMTGEANLNLTIHKKAMMEQNSYLAAIIKTIQERDKQVLCLDKERDIISQQADALEVKLDEVRKVRLAYEVPDVMEYVKVKSEYTDLKHSVKLLENRVHIKQIALTSINKQLQSMLKH